jgi:peptidoglycan hydrolase CwlO-like protein
VLLLLAATGFLAVASAILGVGSRRLEGKIEQQTQDLQLQLEELKRIQPQVERLKRRLDELEVKLETLRRQ